MAFRESIVPRLVRLLDPLVCRQNWRRLDQVLEELAGVEDLFFVQIGANDGVIHDPLYRHITENRWRGILVEPVKVYFDRLRTNYSGNDQLVFENVAISARDGVREFYRLREGLHYLPRWAEGLGSFNRDVLMKHRWAIPGIEDYIVTESVNCLSLATLLDRHQVRRVDLVMIDTEGYDFEIIRQLDFDRLSPRVLLYEHKHLSARDRKQCEALLAGTGYILRRHFSNTLAIRQ